LNSDEKKQRVAKAALEYIVENTIIGVGTGSTANYFINALATIKHKIDGAVASSNATAERLKSHGIPVFELNNVNKISVYIGADESKSICTLKVGGVR
jgi:ribose 5-phosphate isomerase A